MKRPAERDLLHSAQLPVTKPQTPLQYSASAADLSSAEASAATRESTASLWEPRPSPQSSHDSEGTARQGCESEGEGSGNGMKRLRAGQMLDIREQPAWERVAAGVEDVLAVLLRGEEMVAIKIRQMVNCCSTSQEMGNFYIRVKSGQEQEEAQKFRPPPISQEETARRMCALSATQEGHPLGTFQTWHLQKESSQLNSLLAAKQLVSLLGGVIPSELQPATEVAKRENWLAYSSEGVAATELRLTEGGFLWTSGFTKSAAALSPVCLSLPVATSVQEMGEGTVHRTWVLQQDEEALAGSEAVLQAVRAEALGATKLQNFRSWEEVDSQAAVFGPDNLLGSAIQVVQRQGDLLALQRQGHCSYGSGGVYLSWNIASGANWPSAALREGRIRGRAIRQAAMHMQDPWFSTQKGQQPARLHVLRLLFAAACSVEKAHSCIVEGLQEWFLPLCQVECSIQAASSLPQLNARHGILEGPHHEDLRCTCCAGEYIFSYVALVERKGERGGRVCWQCWEQRERIGLQQHCRNARKCVIVQPADLHRLMLAVQASRPRLRLVKRAKHS